MVAELAKLQEGKLQEGIDVEHLQA